FRLLTSKLTRKRSMVRVHSGLPSNSLNPLGCEWQILPAVAQLVTFARDFQLAVAGLRQSGACKFREWLTRWNDVFGPHTAAACNDYASRSSRHFRPAPGSASSLHLTTERP